MWRVALGILVFVQVEAARAGEAAPAGEQEGAREAQGQPSAAPTDCASGSEGDDCVGDDAVAPAAPAAVVPAAVAPAAPSPTAFATVSFRNDVGPKLRLVEARFAIDGEKLPVVLTSAAPGKSYVITSGAVKPGPHVVSAHLTYQGDRGVFSYMKGYKLNVRSAQRLTTPADRTVSFTVVGHENKGMAVPLEKSVVVTVEDGARR
jgi:hypothetical protein